MNLSGRQNLFLKFKWTPSREEQKTGISAVTKSEFKFCVDAEYGSMLLS
jgi:hypothetical protein